MGKAFGQCSFKLTGDGLAARCNRIFQSPAALFVVDAYQREDVMLRELLREEEEFRRQGCGVHLVFIIGTLQAPVGVVRDEEILYRFHFVELIYAPIIRGDQ